MRVNLALSDRLNSEPTTFYGTNYALEMHFTNCYILHFPGFVHTSSTINLEAAISRTSTYEVGKLEKVTCEIWQLEKKIIKEANKTEKMLQDLISGNWWVAMGVINVKAVGYWPAEIFTTLSKHTTMSLSWLKVRAVELLLLEAYKS
ncbi:hypothetical protein YC2023_024514 [Brassica napus]